MLIEKSKTAVMLTQADIREYYEQALRLEPKMLITYLIKEIVLYDDRIEITYNSPLTISPDDSRGFLFCTKHIVYRCKRHNRKEAIKYEYVIEMRI